MTEDQLEQEALGWLASVGYTPLNARDYDHLDPRLVRASNREVVLAMSHAFSLCCTLSEAKAVRDEQLGLHDDEVKFYDARTARRNAQEDCPRIDSQSARKPVCRLVRARERTGQTATLGQADFEEVQVPTRSAR